jgi:hypothetical protein
LARDDRNSSTAVASLSVTTAQQQQQQHFQQQYSNAGAVALKRINSFSSFNNTAAAAAAASQNAYCPVSVGSLPPGSIDMSDLDNLVKRVESMNRLASHDNDSDDDGDDVLLQHHNLMRSSSAYSLTGLAGLSPRHGNTASMRAFGTSPGYLSSSLHDGISNHGAGSSSSNRVRTASQTSLQNSGHDVTIGNNSAPRQKRSNSGNSNGSLGVTFKDVTADTGASGVAHTTSSSTTQQQQQQQQLSWPFMGLQRGSSIVGDPGEHIFRTYCIGTRTFRQTTDQSVRLYISSASCASMRYAGMRVA